MSLIVTSFFWVDDARDRKAKPTADEVRIWDRMVARHLSIPHRRVCVTHRPDMIDFMETMPLDMAKHVPGTCLVKLQAHKIGGVGKEGDRVLLMDIDCVVTGALDELVTAEPVKLWKNPNFECGARRGFYQGSMQLFTVGATEYLWRDMDPRSTPAWLNRRFGGAEQCWISERTNNWWPSPGWDWDIPHWTEADGVYGAGRLFGGKMGAGIQTELPEGARIVFFPGDRSPGQKDIVTKHPWIERHYH